MVIGSLINNIFKHFMRKILDRKFTVINFDETTTQTVFPRTRIVVRWRHELHTVCKDFLRAIPGPAQGCVTSRCPTSSRLFACLFLCHSYQGYRRIDRCNSTMLFRFPLRTALTLECVFCCMRQNSIFFFFCLYDSDITTRLFFYYFLSQQADW